MFLPLYRWINFFKKTWTKQVLEFIKHAPFGGLCRRFKKVSTSYKINLCYCRFPLILPSLKTTSNRSINCFVKSGLIAKIRIFNWTFFLNKVKIIKPCDENNFIVNFNTELYKRETGFQFIQKDIYRLGIILSANI